MKPKKKRGFRKIVVENETFNWRFNDVLDIRNNANPDAKLIVDIGYFDIWLFPTKTPDFEPKIITPLFVKEAIQYALKNGWNVSKNKEQLKLNYQNHQFELIENKN